MRVAIAGILHESNSFSSVLTSLTSFRTEIGQDVIDRWSQAHHEVGGFVEGASRFGYELYPVLVGNATPSGKVTAEAFETLAGQLVTGLRAAPPLDGLLLALHGAMVS